MVKDEKKLCVKLPNRDHMLQVWFAEHRDFLVSVCILRKAGFDIDEGKVGRCRNNSALNSSSIFKQARTKATRATHSSSTSPLATSTPLGLAQARCPQPPGAMSPPPGKNIFDEILESLNKLSETPRKPHASQDDSTLKNIGPEDPACVGPNNTFTTEAALNLHKLTVDSVLGDIPNQYPHSCNETQQLKASNAELSSRTHRPRHRYYTRSFTSLSSGTQQTVKPKTRPSPLGLQRNSSVSVDKSNVTGTFTSVSSSFDSTHLADFRQLMPRRRRLPFYTDTKTETKTLKATSTPARAVQRRNVGAPQIARSRTQNTSTRESHQETTIILTQPTSVDELDGVAKRIFCQYERDIAGGYDAESYAKFYWERLQVARTNFWWDQLMKANSTGHDMLAEI